MARRLPTRARTRASDRLSQNEVGSWAEAMGLVILMCDQETIAAPIVHQESSDPMLEFHLNAELRAYAQIAQRAREEQRLWYGSVEELAQMWSQRESVVWTALAEALISRDYSQLAV